jgi:FlaG/FlaF family flagellin (archaellin)
MENGKARILAAFDPCVLTNGKVLLNLPDEKGIQLVGAKIQDGQTTQSAIVPIQRIAPTAPGQAQYFIDLTEQSTGLDLVSGNPVNLTGGNVNALLLMNLGGENVQLGADNKVNMDAALTKASTTTGTQPPTLASQPPEAGGGSGG